MCLSLGFPGEDHSPENLLLHGPFSRKPKRIRTAFSPSQLLRLERAFEKNHYVVGAERKQLASGLCLTETQVGQGMMGNGVRLKTLEQWINGRRINVSVPAPSSSSSSSSDKLRPCRHLASVPRTTGWKWSMISHTSASFLKADWWRLSSGRYDRWRRRGAVTHQRLFTSHLNGSLIHQSALINGAEMIPFYRPLTFIGNNDWSLFLRRCWDLIQKPEVFLCSCTLHLNIKKKNNSNDFSAVLSHFRRVLPLSGLQVISIIKL